MFWIKYLSIVLFCVLMVFVPRMHHDKKSLNSRKETYCGTYEGDVSFIQSRRVTIPFFKIVLPNGQTIFFKKRLSLSQQLSFFLWGEDLSETKKTLSNMYIGHSYCIVFSIDYYEEFIPSSLGPTPYLINIKSKE